MDQHLFPKPPARFDRVLVSFLTAVGVFAIYGLVRSFA
jgi:hypothetical protein